ncbi:MAG: pantoate--beta-alanine ligase [Verrucomicrobiae bacterium]|nr:pantoate--beta-alanine ligase [Verrucomicrobiae bacterium]
MKIIHSIKQTREFIRQSRKKGASIVFVPTMGALHEGHLSLLARARQLAGPRGIVAASIFVNPTQFNDPKDLAKYPRTLSADAVLCRRAGADLIFAPSANEMYASDFSTWVNEGFLSLPLCGASRPGHFRGVCTVVLKLFNIVQPDIAIFGQKDAQQAMVIQRMTRDLNCPVRIVIAPTVREKDGLAMSSRNRRLSSKQRTEAVFLNRALQSANDAFRAGIRSSAELIRNAKTVLRQASHMRPDYLELVSSTTLRPVKKASKGDLLVAAVFLGSVRLIDNRRID